MQNDFGIAYELEQIAVKFVYNIHKSKLIGDPKMVSFVVHGMCARVLDEKEEICQSFVSAD